MNQYRPIALTLLFFLSVLPCFAQTGIATTRLGDGTGEDWEPAIVADGSNVYAFWPHYGSTTYPDSSGSTCMPFAPNGGGNKGVTYAYMYFQSSSNGGTNWSSVSIPRCPAFGTDVDAQLAIGANHRLYASYMDGNWQYTPIMVIDSEDHGSTCSTPVDVTN